MTPTSATGAEAGFSLVEVMVALVILGLLTGAVLTTLPPEGPRLSDEAERMAARLEHARGEALTANRSVELSLGAEGYAFREQQRGVWTAMEDGALAPRSWPEGLAVSVESADGRPAVRFDSTGAAEPATIRLSHKERAVSVSVDGEGEVRVDDAR